MPFSRQMALFEEGWEDSNELIEAVVSMAEANGGVIRTKVARERLEEVGLLPFSKIEKDAPKVRRAASAKLHRVLSRSDAFVRVRHGEYKLRSTYHAKQDLTPHQHYLLRQMRGNAAPYNVAARDPKKIGF